MRSRLLFPLLPLLLFPAFTASAQENVADAVAKEVDRIVDEAESETRAAGSAVERLQRKLEKRGFDTEEVELILSAADAIKAAVKREPAEIDPSVLRVLSGDQLANVLIAQENARKARYDADKVPAVAIVVPVASFLFILGVVWVVLYLRNRAQRERQQTLRLMVEKGTEIPPGLVASEQKQGSDLRRGLILVFASIGVSGFLFVVDRSGEAWSLGLVPFMVGLGYLVAYRLEEGARDLP